MVILLIFAHDDILIFSFLHQVMQVSIEVFWHAYTWNLKLLRMRKLQLLINIIYQFLDMIWIWNLHRGYFLINEVGQWFHQLNHLTFSENVFWSVNFTLRFGQICYIQKLTPFIKE